MLQMRGIYIETPPPDWRHIRLNSTSGRWGEGSGKGAEGRVGVIGRVRGRAGTRGGQRGDGGGVGVRRLGSAVAIHGDRNLKKIIKRSKYIRGGYAYIYYMIILYIMICLYNCCGSTKQFSVFLEIQL